MSTITKYQVKVGTVIREFLTEQDAIEFAFANNTTFTSVVEDVPVSLPFESFQARVSQEMAIEFARNTLHDWMRKNTFEGMTIEQSLWVFARFEEFTIKGAFGDKRVDVFKMFNSGALPTLFYCLLRVEPDSMVERYHWLTEDRIEWVRKRVSDFIGPEMTAYVASLP